MTFSSAHYIIQYSYMKMFERFTYMFMIINNLTKEDVGTRSTQVLTKYELS
jgi:hypothetical protein